MRHKVVTAPSELRSAEAEQLYRKQRLAGAFRLFARFGLFEGAAGHISARDPLRPDCFWMNPSDVHWAHMRVSDLILIDSEGAVVEGHGSANPAGIAIHGQLLDIRRDAISIAHSHSPYGKAWSALRRHLDPLTQDACAFYDDHELVPFTAIVLDDLEGKQIGAILGTKKAAILENHGLLTVGRSVEEAAWWFISMERQCQVQLLAEAAGQARLIDAATAAATAAIQGSDSVGRLQFDVLWKFILAECPDLLE